MALSVEERLRARLADTGGKYPEAVSPQAMSGYLVKRLVAAGTFMNVFASDGTVEGFEVKVANRLGAATLTGVAPLVIDGEKFATELITIRNGNYRLEASGISEAMPLTVNFGDELAVFVKDGLGLEAGAHRIELELKMTGLGTVRYAYSDELSGEGRERIKKPPEPVIAEAGAASEGLEFEEAGAETEGGAIEDFLGVSIAAFDDVLKKLDGLLGFFGVKYFYDKSLNRMERLWELLDKEVRKQILSTRAREKEGGKRSSASKEKRKPSTPPAEYRDEQVPKPSPAAAPVKSLHDRLKDRLASTDESAAKENSLSAVSGYLVKKIIARGGFKNFGAGAAPEGFEVLIRNKIGADAMIGFTPIDIDGTIYATDLIEIAAAGGTVRAAEISENNPLAIAFGGEALVRVLKPGGLERGGHRVRFGVDMAGLGRIDVEYEDELAG